jgi:hypothetical protein
MRVPFSPRPHPFAKDAYTVRLAFVHAPFP